jgi:hypothetical protein
MKYETTRVLAVAAQLETALLAISRARNYSSVRLGSGTSKKQKIACPEVLTANPGARLVILGPSLF